MSVMFHHQYLVTEILEIPQIQNGYHTV